MIRGSGKKARARELNTGRADARIVHYYARFLVHPSGVTDALVHWLEANRRVDPNALLVAARPRKAHFGNRAEEARVRTVPHLGWGRSTWVPVGLLRLLARGDVLVLHEGWVISNLFAALIARLRGATYVVMPHGVYEPEVVAAQRDLFGLRRRLEAIFLRGAVAVHVFYEGEQKVVKSIERTVTRFIIAPNGAPSAQSKWQGAGDYYLYLGRIDPHHKGLDNLVRFWATLPRPVPRLRLVGPDFQNGKREMSLLISQLGLAGAVTLEGHVAGELKESLMREARAYLHPARWESCSITLLEMLSMGVPSLVSSSIHAASELGSEGIFLTADFAAGGKEVVQLLTSVSNNRDMSTKAAAWAADEGSWHAVSAKSEDQYRILVTQASEVPH